MKPAVLLLYAANVLAGASLNWLLASCHTKTATCEPVFVRMPSIHLNMRMLGRPIAAHNPLALLPGLAHCILTDGGFILVRPHPPTLPPAPRSHINSV